MKKVTLTILVVLITGGVFFLTYARMEAVENFFLKVFTPFFKGARLIGRKVVYPFKRLVAGQARFAEIEALRQENLALKNSLSDKIEIERENDFLRKALNIKAEQKSKKVLARVIGKRTNLKGAVYLINTGKKDGIKEGQTVVVPGGVLVGRVLGAYEDFAKVLPATNKASSIAVFTQASRVEGVLRGQGKGEKLVLDLISFEKEVAKENVITSGMDQIFVPGILIGKITKVEFLPQESSKQALVEPLFDNTLVEKVFVIIE